MAYQSNTKYSGAANKTQPMAAKKGTDVTSKPVENIFKTGLFASDKGGKTLASVQVREDVLIPAGSYINLFANEQKTENHPPFTISVRPGVLKAK